MNLRANLDEELTERFRVVKENSLMKSNKNVLAYLISKEYDRIQDTKYRKLYVAPETYDQAEKKAAARGQTVEIYVQELMEEQMRKPGA